MTPKNLNTSYQTEHESSRRSSVPQRLLAAMAMAVVMLMLAPLVGAGARHIESAGRAPSLETPAAGDKMNDDSLVADASTVGEVGTKGGTSASLLGQLVGGVADLLEPEADARSHRVQVKGWPCLNARQRATTSSPAKRCLRYNSWVSVACYVSGQRITSAVFRGYTTSLWWKTTSGDYVSDAYLLTGYNGPIPGSRKCSTSTPSAPAPAGTKATRAADWALRQIGSNNWHWQCERFVENAYNTSGRFGSAIQHYRWERNNSRIRTSWPPPKGAIVFYAAAPENGHYGHVAISVGGGQAVSNARNNGATITKHAVKGWVGASYLGWSYAPASWPGR